VLTRAGHGAATVTILMILRSLRLAAPAACLIAGAALAQGTPAAPASPATIAVKTAGLVRVDGYVPMFLDEKTGKVLLEIARDSLRVLHFVNQATGLGSNPIGVDRGGGQMDNLVRFDRLADRVLVTFENTRYRSSGTADHARSVRESFPNSVVAALPIVAEEGGRFLVDATDFALRDWLDVAGTLQETGQGTYAIARDRSGVLRANTRGYPDNSELDVALTYVAQGKPSQILSQVAPDGRAVQVRLHHSFVKLPDDRFRPREGDPRVGFFGLSFKDYARDIQRPLDVWYISRHRIERADMNDTRSPVTKPIVYYVDRGIPEPMRTASLEGARFWVQAFDQAGLVGGFKVELLPEGVDPMDARYNVVQWVNRNERGWSIGGSVGDPRTGEIVKAMARMDSHRARTDYNLYAGLMGAAPASADTAFVLARVRQVTAHEIGHTLGLAHNYMASTYERGSVMDYPAPRVRLSTGRIDVSQAYATGPGAYDVWAVRWGYGVYPPASEADSLRAIMREGLAKGYLFLTDQDARPENASDPRVTLWDDAGTPEEFLRHQTDVRRVAINKFGLANLRPGEAVALLQERFVPLYFWHRFALNGVTKAVGGMEYSNAVVGDGQQATRTVPAARQRAALAQLIAQLAPAELAIPDTVVTLLAPRAFGSDANTVELFRSRTTPAFDEFGAARTLAGMVVDNVLQVQRAGRLAQQGARDATQLSLGETIDALVSATWDAPLPAGPRKYAAIQQATQRAVAERLLVLAADASAANAVRALAEYKLGTLRGSALAKAKAAGGAERGATASHWLALAADIARWQERRELPALTRTLVAPPGDPFGDEP
jgi:hypothetical protein